MAITLIQLTHFLAVAHNGSFSAAARRLGLGQPAISQSVAALEQQLGVRLFDRTSTACRLTSIGKEFVGDAVRITLDVDSTVRRMKLASKGKKHRLVLGMTGGMSALLTEWLLRATGQSNVSLDLTVIEGSIVRLREMLAEGRIDCALIYDVDPDEPQLRSHIVAYEPMHLVGAPDLISELGNAKLTHLHQIARLPLFLANNQNEAGAGQVLVRQAMKENVALDIRYELQSTSAIRRLLLQDRLATVICLGVVIDDLANNYLSSRVVEIDGLTRSVCLATPAFKAFGTAEALLLANVRNIAEERLIPSGLWARERGHYCKLQLDGYTVKQLALRAGARGAADQVSVAS